MQHTCLYAVCISKLHDVKLLLGDVLHYPTGGLSLSMFGYHALTSQNITISCIPVHRICQSVLDKVLYSSVCQITHQAPNTLLSLTHTAMAHLAQGKLQFKVLPSAFYLANLCNYILFHLLPSVAFVKKTKGVLSEWSDNQSVNSCFITFVIFISYVAFTYYFRLQLLSYAFTYHIHHIYAYFVSVYFGCGPE